MKGKLSVWFLQSFMAPSDHILMQGQLRFLNKPITDHNSLNSAQISIFCCWDTTAPLPSLKTSQTELKRYTELLRLEHCG